MIKHTNLKYDEAYEEVVARLSESFLRDAHLTEKSRELYNTDKSVWEKVRDGLRDIIDRIEEFLANLSPDSDLGKIGMKMAQENREILDRFLAGVRAASDNAAYIKKTTDEGGVRMMGREDEYSDYNKPITAHDISVLHDN
jgi:vacuolar-type H+-ATPase subunit E/Vma4